MRALSGGFGVRRSVLTVLAGICLVACSGGVPSAPASPTPGSSGPAGTPPDPALALPSRASLIQQAQAEGRIDEVTALEYRAMAMFGVPGLPDEFAAGVPRGDSAALAAMAAMVEDLSPADQARFRPFLARPTEAGSIFAPPTQASVTDVAGELGASRVAVTSTAACRTWAHSDDLDSRFKVWACADADPAAAEIDIATVVTIMQRHWDRMSNDMGGPPLPDAHGPNVPAEYGGDARIDLYALHLGQVIYRSGANQIPSDAAAATVPAPPFTNPDGSWRNASSAFMLLNVDTLENDEETFELDLIHEFFHALQLAHNFRATHRGSVEHWFVEASATWSETYYLRASSEQPHAWIFPFQQSGLGLQDADLDHQYASYVWPLFMEQERGATAVFNAWRATDAIGPGDFDAVTATVDDQLEFESRFRDFAVRNLNLNDVLRPASETRYDELDGNFFDDSPPVSIPGAFVVPGTPYVSPDQSIPGLAARYFEPEFSEEARDITINLGQLQSSGNVDGDFLAHYADGSWKRHRISGGGMLRFCRDDEGWDINRGYLVVSNHHVTEQVTGRFEIDAKDSCGDPDVIVLQGTLRGSGRSTPNHVNGLPNQTEGTFQATIEVTITIEPHDWTTTGTASVSGEYTGDCQFEDSDSGQLVKHTMRGSDPTDDTDMVAFVQVYSHDPRFAQRPLTGMYIAGFAKTAGHGGTCGHNLGYVDDAFPALTVALTGCDLEILNNNGSWHGQCSRQSDINPDTNLPYSEFHWTANLEQISPRSSPPPVP